MAATDVETYATSSREEANGVRVCMVELAMEADYANPGGWHFDPSDFGFSTRVGAMVLNSPEGFRVRCHLVPTGVNVVVDKIADIGAGVYGFAECADNEAGLAGLTVAGFVVGY